MGRLGSRKSHEQPRVAQVINSPAGRAMGTSACPLRPRPEGAQDRRGLRPSEAGAASVPRKPTPWGVLISRKTSWDLWICLPQNKICVGTTFGRWFWEVTGPRLQALALESRVPKRCVHTRVHSNTVHNSQKAEVALVSISG